MVCMCEWVTASERGEGAGGAGRSWRGGRGSWGRCPPPLLPFSTLNTKIPAIYLRRYHVLYRPAVRVTGSLTPPPPPQPPSLARVLHVRCSYVVTTTTAAASARDGASAAATPTTTARLVRSLRLPTSSSVPITITTRRSAARADNTRGRALPPVRASSSTAAAGDELPPPVGRAG